MPEINEIKQLLEYSPYFTWPFFSAFLMFLLYKAGILGAITSWATRQPNNGRIDVLESFKETIEGNHLHSLEKLIEKVDKLDDEIGNIRERLVRIETRLNGKL